MESSYSLEQHCYDNVCHCDWRLTLYGCVESQAVRIIYIFNIVISALVSVVGKAHNGVYIQGICQ
jgi:hypothetical protein